MYTVETALESLKKFDVTDADIKQWEKAINLDIPVDAYGRKQYSPHHINLFKNIRKHLALGRTLNEIKQIVALPPLNDSQASAVQGKTSQNSITSRHAEANTAEAANATVVRGKSPKNAYASVPSKPALQNGTPGGNGAANVVQLVQRLTQEKDQLYKKLLETEKLNSHLYSANSLFHRKVKDMTTHINQLREQMKENENFKLLDDKAKLHKQLISAEKYGQYKEEEIQRRAAENQALKQTIADLERQIQSMTASFDARRFVGNWMETGQLIETVYDNFGVNIESERVRLFRIPEPPSRLYGNTAIITTSYQYETNNLWKRNEILTVSYVDAETLEGELTAEYILDGVPVAKALYRITCRRSQ